MGSRATRNSSPRLYAKPHRLRDRNYLGSLEKSCAGEWSENHVRSALLAAFYGQVRAAGSRSSYRVATVYAARRSFSLRFRSSAKPLSTSSPLTETIGVAFTRVG